MTRAPSASSAEGWPRRPDGRLGRAPTGRRPDRVREHGDRAVLGTVALAALLVPLNSTMIAVALPRLVDDLGTSLTSASWLVTGYLIAMASLQPVAGKLGDRFGRRPLVLGGLAWFAVASAGAAAADGLGLLVAFRLQQAVAGALFFPNAIALLRETAPPGRLGTRMGIAGAAIPLGAAAGPPLGGLLLAAGGWQWIFLINLPLVAAALVLGARAIPVRRAATATWGAFDRAGAVLLTATLGCGAWALNGSGLDAGSAAALGGLALLLLAAFVRVELRRPDPVVQPRLFARPGFGAASAGVALSNLAMYVTLLALPVLLVRQGRPGEAVAGLVLASMSAASLVVTPLGGRVVDRMGSRVPAVTGLSVLALSLVPLALWPAEAGPAAMVACMLVAGTGLGLASSALQVAAIGAVDPGSAGVASGVFSTSRYAGSIVGTALLAGPLAPADAGTAGFGLLFALLAVAAAASAACATRLPGASRRHAGPRTASAPAPAAARA